MECEIDFKVHNENLISYKDFNRCLDISDSKWDKLFSTYISISKKIFFYGVRKTHLECNMKDYINLIPQRAKSNEDLIINVNFGDLIISRNRIGKLWRCYEYSFLFFFENDMINFHTFFKEQWLLEDVIKNFTNCFVLYKSFESEVLWLAKSHDSHFPEVPNSF